MEFMGVVCRDAVNDCDIAENCTGDSSQVSSSLVLRASHGFMQQDAFFMCVRAATLPSCNKARCITGPQDSKAF